MLVPLSNVKQLQERVRPFVVVMQVKSKTSKRPRPTTERKRKVTKKRASPSISTTDICGTLARLQEKHTIALKEHEDEKKLDFDSFAPALKLLKGILFKMDMPYRARLPFQGNVNTNSSGVLNVTLSNTNIGSTAEWASISALFDEFFIHSLTFNYVPVNDLGGGVGVSATSSGTGGVTATACTQSNNSGLLACCLFNGVPAYTTASALAANATTALKKTAHSWKYVWRNNMRFDPRGDCLPLASWQGWTVVGNTGNYGGQIQLRTLGDIALGSGSAALTLGQYLAYFDVSFRARA